MAGRPCTTQRDAPKADLALAGATVGLGGVVIGASCARSCTGELVGIGAAIAGVVALHFLASAAYGYSATAVCRSLTPGWEVRDRYLDDPRSVPDVFTDPSEGARGRPCNWKNQPGNCQPGLLCVAQRCRPIPRARPATQPATASSQPASAPGCRLIPRSDCPTGVGCATGGCVDPGPW